MTSPKTRKAEITSDMLDPNIANEDRTFELVYREFNGEGIDTFRYRLRAKKGGIEDQVFFLGSSESHPAYMGMISEQKGNGHWGPYTWGHLPVPAAMAKEVFPAMEKPAKKEDTPVDPAEKSS